MERDNNGRFAASPPMRSPERERLAEAIAAEQAATARLARLRTTLASNENQSYDLSEAITEKEQAIAEAERRAPQSRLAILLGDLAPAADPLPALRDELTALREQRAALVEDIATLREGISGNPQKNAPGAAGALGDSLPSPPPSEWAPALQKMRTDPDAPLPKTRVEAPGVG